MKTVVRKILKKVFYILGGICYAIFVIIGSVELMNNTTI
jgi:hypothetical protein